MYNPHIPMGYGYRLVVTPYCHASVYIVIAVFDRFKACTLGHDALPKVLVKGRSGSEICRGISEALQNCGRTGGKEGQCGSFCGNYCPIISLTREYDLSAGFMELPRPSSLSPIPQKTALLWARSRG